MLRGIGLTIALTGAAVLFAASVWLRLSPPHPAPPSAFPPTAAAPSPARVAPAPPFAPRPVVAQGDCGVGDAAGAVANAASLDTASVAPSGPAETGWAAYAPLAAREVGTRCGPATPAFAAALGRWRGAHALGDGGVMDAATLKAIVVAALLRRPFVQATRRGECPAAPDPSGLATALPGETQGGKVVQAAPAVLEAWRRMRAAARAEVPALATDPRLLSIASGFRGPAEEAARCAAGGCDTVSRSRCSAHRTGSALDLVLSTDAAVNPLSTAEADRKALARTPAYRWLVANADRFGFLPYPYEPWHWEWAGG